MKTLPHQSRRALLRGISGASMAMLLHPSSLWAAADGALDPRVPDLVRSTMGIDTHNHVDVPLNAAEVPGPDIELAAEMRRSGLSAICMTFAVDYQALRERGQAYDRFINGLTSMDAQLRRSGMKRALSLDDLRQAHAQALPTVIQSVEGAHFLEGQLERLDEAYARGLRHLGLLHDHNASPPLGDIYTEAPELGGLTAWGADVIRACNRLGIMIDLTHASAACVAAALKVTQQPVLYSHTGLDSQLGKNEFMARMMRPRLISKEGARRIADAGGVIGVWTHLSDTPLAYAEHLRAMVDVVGVEHVCIGTDTKLTTPIRLAPGGPMGPGRPPAGASAGDPGRPPGAEDRGRGPGGAGGPGGPRVGERTNQAWTSQSSGFYYAVVDAMLKTGFSPAEISLIGGGNFCRVFGAAIASKKA